MSTQSTASASQSSASTERAGTDGDLTDRACDVSHLTQGSAPESPVGEDVDTNAADDASSRYIVGKLKDLYRNHIVEAEKRYHLHFNFCLPTDGEIKDNEFDAAPMVLLIGQYSTGKTTFLNHLLGEDFPGMHIGPEPTTDKFMALYHGGDNEAKSDTKTFNSFRKTGTQHDDDASRRSIVTDDIRASGRLVKGNTLTVTPNLPFSSLSQFGSAFLNHFVGSACASPLLKRISFVDTPGVLSGEKQRINRTYDFGQVAKWFADRSDLILLLFDAHKLDISDEFKNVIDTIRQHNDDKIRCVLNKADCVTREQLVRVYGSLMWSMGKIFDSPEVVRVYTGSYWNSSLQNDDFKRMFENDEKLLVKELIDLPRCAAERKVNQMVNRIRLVKVHVCILGTLRRMTPLWFGKKKAREHIFHELESIFDNVRVEFDLSKGDMPDPHAFARCLHNFSDFGVFPPIDKALISRLDELIDKDIPEIVRDADVVEKEVRLGKRSSFEEEEKANEAKPVDDIEQKEPEPCDDEKVEDCQSTPNILDVLGKVVLFCLLLASVVEGAYYWNYSKPAYSLGELQDGYRQMNRKLSKMRKKMSSPPTPKGAAPLSSLPTLSGVAYTAGGGSLPKKSSDHSEDEL